MEVENVIQRIWLMAIDYAPRILLAILTLVIGLWIIKRLVRLTKKLLSQRFDDTVAGFLTGVLSVILKVLLVFSVAAKLGFDTTSFIVVLGALMIGIGMAFNGTIGHLASGIMLLIFRPFKLDDLVEIGGGERGWVHEINVFYTTLKTLDNQRIMIANSNVMGNTITNISGQDIIGVDLTYGIGYEDGIDKARSIILEVGKSCPHVLNDPPQSVNVATLNDSSVDLVTRPFCKSEDYRAVRFYMNEHVKKAFDKAGVSIPFPQMDIHTSNVN